MWRSTLCLVFLACLSAQGCPSVHLPYAEIGSRFSNGQSAGTPGYGYEDGYSYDYSDSAGGAYDPGETGGSPYDDWSYSTGDSSVPPTDDPAPVDPPAESNADVCATNGWYGDGVCDTDCAQPDPDCDDVCAVNGWYNDGVCDTDCAQPDPDCDDVCAVNGWYSDGVCDTDCAQPDPDCTQ